jgi:hypothetical protein
MSLLADLRAAAPVDAEEPPYWLLKRLIPLLVPGAEVTKVETFSDGHVGVRARSPMRGSGRFYVVAVLDKVGTGLPDGRREVLMGASRYRDEGDAMIFDRPWRGYIEPQPGAMAAWMAGVLLTEDPHFSPNR